MTSSADRERLKDWVDRLAAKPRPPGSEQHAAARSLIANTFGALGYHVELERFEYAGLSGLNIFAHSSETDDDRPLLIVGAHYDSVQGSPGADDNASAVAALVEIARLLKEDGSADAPSPYRLELVAYDLEESGILGSQHHVDRLLRERKQVAGMISLEMIGYYDPRPGSQKMPPELAPFYPNRGDFIGVVGNERSRDFIIQITNGMKETEGLAVESLAVPGNGEALPPTRLSDHSPFWDAGYPAVMVTDTSFFRNPHYHLASDTPATLNIDFLTAVTSGVCHALRKMLLTA